MRLKAVGCATEPFDFVAAEGVLVASSVASESAAGGAASSVAAAASVGAEGHGYLEIRRERKDMVHTGLGLVLHLRVRLYTA